MSPRRSTVLLSLLPLVLLASCGSDGGSDGADGGDEEKVLVIGYAGGFTGDAAVGDVPALAGAKFAVEQINANGGAGGYTLKLISQDMQSDSTLGGTVAQELVDEGADVLIGPAFPGMASGILQVAGNEGIPVIAGCSTQPEYTLMSQADVFLAAFGDNVQAAAVAEYLLEDGFERAYTVSSPDMTYTGNGARFFAEAFEQGGGTVLGDSTYSIGQTDFSAQVTAIAAKADEIDVIYTPMFPPDLPSFVRALRSAGVDVPVAGPDGFHTADALAAGQDAMEGTVFATHAFEEGNEAYATFVTEGVEFDATINDGPAIAALGYTSVQIIAAAAEKAQSNDPEALTAALKELSDLQTVTGEITFKGTNGVPQKTVTIGGVENGEFVYRDAFVPAFIPEP